MPDDPSLRGSPDNRRVNLSQPHEVAYWTKELRVTESRLRELVRIHGDRVHDLRKAIGGY